MPSFMMNNVSMEDDGLVKCTTRCLQIKNLEKVNGRRDGSRGLSEGFSAAWWDLPLRRGMCQ